MKNPFLNSEVSITRTVSLYPLLNQWISKLQCENPTKKRIAGPFQSGDTFIGQRPRTHVPVSCGDRKVPEEERCRSCRARLHVIRLMKVLDEDASKEEASK